ncbi:MAG: hypothetical protein OEM18_00810 [Nitrosopumilus sp.]|nr:hypothetical protein [Nitrosopumilus sp.]MDH3500960.1 hypothetical protein [Nitrosopumilus sp.]
MKDRHFVIIGLIVGIIGFASFIGVIGQGNVRHVEIFWPEKVEQTVAFKDIDDKVVLVGILGTAEDDNPTLIIRTSFAYILTVENHGNQHHRLYIEGFNVQTDLLEPGQTDTITIYPDKEGIFNYYDKREKMSLLGQLKSVQVVPSDGFTGFLKDMI